MTVYSHTQRGTQMIIGLGAIGVLFALIAAYGLLLVIGGEREAVAMVAPVLAVAPMLIGFAVMFASMTVRIHDGRLEWWFGKGFPRYSHALTDIRSARIWPSRGYAIGIHWTRDGWLYNVSGMKGVHVTLHSGKQFVVGTDEPEELVFALNAAVSDNYQEKRA